MAFDANLISSFQDLTQLLDRDGVFHKTELADKTVQIPTQRGTLDSVMIVRWQDADGVIQFIQGLPLEVPDDKLGAVVDAVARLNHVLAIPGFDINHQRKILAYRLYLPIYPRGSVKSAEIQAMFRLTVKTAADLMPVFSGVIAGTVRPEDVVAEAQKAYTAAEAAAAAPAAAPAPAAPPSKDMY